MKLKQHQTRNYKCENCGAVEKHIDMHDDKYCYNCWDIEAGKLKEINKSISEN